MEVVASICWNGTRCDSHACDAGDCRDGNPPFFCLSFLSETLVKLA